MLQHGKQGFLLQSLYLSNLTPVHTKLLILSYSICFCTCCALSLTCPFPFVHLTNVYLSGGCLEISLNCLPNSLGAPFSVLSTSHMLLLQHLSHCIVITGCVYFTIQRRKFTFVPTASSTLSTIEEVPAILVE